MYKGVDVGKFFFSICVVSIHSVVCRMLPDQISYYFEKGLLRLAVPFFFVASGYLFMDTLRKQQLSLKEKLFKQIHRLIKPFIVFGLVNTFLNVGILLYSEAPHPWLTIIQHFFFYPYGALWYVLATIVGLFLLYPFIKYNKMELALGIGVGLYSFALLCNSYYFVANQLHISHTIDSYRAIFISARNGLFVGFLFIGLGIMLAQKNILKYLSFKTIVYTTGLMFVFYIGEIFCLFNCVSVDDGAYFILSPLISASLVLLTLKVKVPISDRASILCRNLSVGIFFLHGPIQLTLVIACFVLLKKRFVDLSGGPCLLFILDLFICIVVCLSVYKFKKEPFYSLLR